MLPGLLLAVVFPSLLSPFQATAAAGPESSSAEKVEEARPRILRLASLAWQDVRETSFLMGFTEGRFGMRTRNDKHEDDVSMGETRLQLEYEAMAGPLLIEATADFLYDSVPNEHDVQPETGEGWIDLRKAAISFTPVAFADVKVGRQILTWGTGDLLFINDLFPKDWNAFFVGRDEEYLKAPSDAIKLSLFLDPANVDVIYTPRFDANRFPDNRRISQWNPVGNMTVGNEMEMHFDRPDDLFGDDEVALRIYKNIRGYECALYLYDGFWKDPKGFDPITQRGTFPELSVVGASVRGMVGSGIGNIEVGYYDSADDRSGVDNLVPNSQFRFLAGYEQEIARDFTAGLQYYLEFMDDYGAYQRNQPAGAPFADKDRHVVTLRLTKLLLQQNLTLSLFAYWSPSDRDGYLRPNVNYKITDSLAVEGGGNVFLGEERHTFFGQFEDNSNVYAGIRYSF